MVYAFQMDPDWCKYLKNFHLRSERNEFGIDLWSTKELEWIRLARGGVFNYFCSCILSLFFTCSDIITEWSLPCLVPSQPQSNDSSVLVINHLCQGWFKKIPVSEMKSWCLSNRVFLAGSIPPFQYSSSFLFIYSDSNLLQGYHCV